MTFRIQWFLYQYALHTIIVDLDLPMIDFKVVMLCWFYQNSIGSSCSHSQVFNIRNAGQLAWMAPCCCGRCGAAHRTCNWRASILDGKNLINMDRDVSNICT
jgi:hypothetical protein